MIYLTLCTYERNGKEKMFYFDVWSPSFTPLSPSFFLFSLPYFFVLKLGLHVSKKFCELQELLWRGLVSIIRYRVEAKENWRKKAKGKVSSAMLLSRVKKGMKTMHKAKKK